jgi:hypothetical protein
MRTGRTRYGTDVLRVPALHKDGRKLSIAFTVALLYTRENEVQTIVAIVRDETSRWQEDRALRQRLAQLEAPCRRGGGETMHMTSKANRQTVSEALAELAQLGFTANLSVIGNRLRVVETGRTFEPADVVIRRVRRFEGVSDPDDMAIVYAIDTTSGIRGTVVDGYGVNSDPAVSAFFENVPIVEGAR